MMDASRQTVLNCSAMLSPHRKRKTWTNWAYIIIGILLSLGEYSNAQQQHYHRRPIVTSAPGLDAYRNRWMSYIRKQSTPKPAATPTIPARTGGAGQQAQIVNGFYCAKIHAFFTTEDNPRMYHLCARNRESWYVYHFFCPQGSLFDETMKKCSMTRRAPTTSRPFIMSTTTPGTPTTTVKSVILSSANTMSTRKSPGGFASYLGLNGFFTRPTTMASTIRRTTTTTTTTELPEAVPEPESSVTEIGASSEESTEEEMMMGVKNVYVNIPGLTMTSSSSSSSNSLADDGNEEVTTETDMPNDEELNMIPESDTNSGGAALQNSLAYQLQQAASMYNKTNPSKTMEMVASILKANSAFIPSGGRRPRVKKQNKWHYYRFLN